MLLFQSFLTDFDKLERHLSTEGKVVIDLNDPNHPRFTLTELRDILQERNELKTKVISLEEELQQYKPVLVCLSVSLPMYLTSVISDCFGVDLPVCVNTCPILNTCPVLLTFSFTSVSLFFQCMLLLFCSLTNFLSDGKTVFPFCLHFCSFFLVCFYHLIFLFICFW